MKVRLNSNQKPFICNAINWSTSWIWRHTKPGYRHQPVISLMVPSSVW